jgi:hypothetical protein
MKHYPPADFVETPLVRGLYINKDRKVFNATTGTYPKPVRHRKHGYINVNFYDSSEKTTIMVSLARLVASCFVAVPDELKHLAYDGLTIRFKDGNRENLSNDNLLWVRSGTFITPKGPNQSAILTDALTGEVLNFPTIAEAARHVGVEPAQVYVWKVKGFPKHHRQYSWDFPAKPSEA